MKSFALTNMTTITDSIVGNSEIEGAYPRWVTLGQISNPLDSTQGVTASFISHGVSNP